MIIVNYFNNNLLKNTAAAIVGILIHNMALIVHVTSQKMMPQFSPGFLMWLSFRVMAG